MAEQQYQSQGEMEHFYHMQSFLLSREGLYFPHTQPSH